MGRKAATDPKVQRPIYPSRSQWERMEKVADTAGVKPSEYALAATMERVERDERKAARNA